MERRKKDYNYSTISRLFQLQFCATLFQDKGDQLGTNFQ